MMNRLYQDHQVYGKTLISWEFGHHIHPTRHRTQLFPCPLGQKELLPLMRRILERGFDNNKIQTIL